MIESFFAGCRDYDIYTLAENYPNFSLDELLNIQVSLFGGSKEVTQEYNYDILADDALYKRAKIYDDVLKNSELAMKLYEQILLEHNSSIYVAESRKRFRDLRGDNLQDK